MEHKDSRGSFFLLHTGDNPSTISVKFIRKNGFSSISSIPTAEMKGKVPRVLLKITCDTHTHKHNHMGAEGKKIASIFKWKHISLSNYLRSIIYFVVIFVLVASNWCFFPYVLADLCFACHAEHGTGCIPIFFPLSLTWLSTIFVALIQFLCPWSAPCIFVIHFVSALTVHGKNTASLS